MSAAINSAIPAIARFVMALMNSAWKVNGFTQGLWITAMVAMVKAYKATPALYTPKRIKADDASCMYPMQVMISLA